METVLLRQKTNILKGFEAGFKEFRRQGFGMFVSLLFSRCTFSYILLRFIRYVFNKSKQIFMHAITRG